MQLTQVVLSRERASIELARMHKDVLGQITPEKLASGTVQGKTVTHQFCFQLLTSLGSGKNICLVCSRRAGKTYAICCLLILVALRTPNCNSLYLGLVSGPAKKVFNRIWKKILRKFKLTSLVSHSETELITTFYNGSTVTFGGVDDLKHVQTLLGDSMAGGCAVIDEAQSGSSNILKSLVEDVLAPMLDETDEEHPERGFVIVAGTQPKVRAGYLYETNKSAQDPKSPASKRWLCLRWSRFQNPFLTDNEENLQAHLDAYGLKLTDIIIRANWFGEDVYDEAATAFRYREERNAWTCPEAEWSKAQSWFPDGMLGHARFCQPSPEYDQFIVCIDPAATSDRFAIVLWGYSSRSPQGIKQFGEWVTDRAANAYESTYFGVIQKLCSHYKVVGIVRDAGSSSTTQDPGFLAEYGLVIEPAKKGKGSKYARVERLKSLLGQARAFILAGSELELDLKLARWDPDKRADGKYEWTSDCHPDVADAATYGIGLYIESIQVKKKTPEEIEQAEEKASWSPPMPEYGNTGDQADWQVQNNDDSYGGTEYN